MEYLSIEKIKLELVRIIWNYKFEDERFNYQLDRSGNNID